jgi:AcrR family transcriptional regulator
VQQRDFDVSTPSHEDAGGGRAGANGSIRTSPLDAAVRDHHAWRDADPAHRLLRAGTTIFARRGYHAAKTGDIAIAAQMTPSSLYKYFPAKEDLLYQVCLTGHRLALESISDHVEDADARGRLRELIRRFTLWHACNPLLGRVSYYELAHLAPAHLADIAVLRRSTSAIVRGVITDGMDARQFTHCDVRTATQAITSLAVDAVRWFHGGAGRSPASLADDYAELAVRMMSSP